MKKRGIALCLSGGGARGYFHIGVIKALQELKIHIKEISGCSIGAVLGGILASNPKFNFDEIVKDFKFIKLIKLQAKKQSIIDLDKVNQNLRNFIHVEEFEDLQIPLSVNATELHTGREIIFRKGYLIPAIIASMSVPGIFPISFESKTALCDGGFVNLVPFSMLKSNNILISDLTFPLTEAGKMPTRSELLKLPLYLPLNAQVETNLQKLKKNKRKKFVRLHLKKKMELLDFRKSQTDEVLKTGYDMVMKHKKEIRNLVS